MGMPRKKLTQEEITSFRSAYCEAAYKLYQQEDYGAVTMRGIAKVMGCSPMMAYRYFENKEDVFTSLRAIHFHLLADTLEGVSTSQSSLDYLKALGNAYANFAHDEPSSYRLLYVIDIHQIQDHPEMDRAQMRTQKLLLNATRRAVEVGDITGDPVFLAQLYWASVHGLVSLDLANQLTQGSSFDKLFPAMQDSLLNVV